MPTPKKPRKPSESTSIDAYDLLGLVHASVRLQSLYPDFRDNPSDKDKAAWKDLKEATERIASQMGI